jgi:hypothetical protein
MLGHKNFYQLAAGSAPRAWLKEFLITPEKRQTPTPENTTFR